MATRHLQDTSYTARSKNIKIMDIKNCHEIKIHKWILEA